MKKISKNLIIQITKKLNKKDYSLVTAESCTAGGLAHLISLIPHCAAHLDRGYITYSEQSKTDLLGIKPTTLKKYGPVSEIVTLQMAKAALKKSKADISIAISGLAGPNSDEHSNVPIGTVYISCCDRQGRQIIKEKKFSAKRIRVCEKAILAALKILNNFIK